MTLTCCQDHILTESIWFVWSETSYSGDERRCYRCGTTNEQTISEDKATQPMEAGDWVSQYYGEVTPTGVTPRILLHNLWSESLWNIMWEWKRSLTPGVATSVSPVSESLRIVKNIIKDNHLQPNQSWRQNLSGREKPDTILILDTTEPSWVKILDATEPSPEISPILHLILYLLPPHSLHFTALLHELYPCHSPICIRADLHNLCEPWFVCSFTPAWSIRTTQRYFKCTICTMSVKDITPGRCTDNFYAKCAACMFRDLIISHL